MFNAALNFGKKTMEVSFGMAEPEELAQAGQKLAMSAATKSIEAKPQNHLGSAAMPAKPTTTV